VTRGGRRATDPNAEEREFRIAQQLEYLKKQMKRSNRVTREPPTRPPELFCPECGRSLQYRHTVLAGVDPPERWDIFACPDCGLFEYRHRTRKLRRIMGA
jgi:hypothetical protein